VRPLGHALWIALVALLVVGGLAVLAAVVLFVIALNSFGGNK
jgi:hypothetical protein